MTHLYFVIVNLLGKLIERRSVTTTLPSFMKSMSGRRVFHSCCEGKDVSHAGACGSKNVGTSNRKEGETPSRRKIKVFWATAIVPELVGT